MQYGPDNYPESYAAFFAPRKHKFENIDFRVAATPHNLRYLFPKTTRQRQNRALMAGTLGLLVGIVLALIGFGVDQLTRGLTLGLYRATARAMENSYWPGFVTFVLLALAYVMIPALFVVYAAPLGGGSGIPELKAYLNGVRIPGFLSLNSLIVKAVGVAFTISSGLVCGKQGPMIHAGAIIGAALSQAASSTFRWRLRFPYFRFFRTEAWKRDFTAVGAAVGIAVAFGSPMGAWMWIYEEACTHWSWELGIITLIGCLSGAIIVRILNYLSLGQPGGGLGAFTLTQFGKLVTPFDGSQFPLKDIPAFVLLGVVGGIIGAVLPVISKRLTLFRYKHITKPLLRILEALFIGCLSVVLKVLLPYLANDCRDIDENFTQVLRNAPLQDFSSFNCPDGQFSTWAAVIYNPADTVVRGLLFYSGDNVFKALPVAIAAIYYYVFITWTYGIAVPAGIFFPGFVLGSVYGRLLGVIVHLIFPSRTDVSFTGYAFLGAISALAGMTRTISVAVIALEATGGNGASFAAVLVALISKLVGDFLYRCGIYDLHVNLKGMPYLENAVPHLELYSQVLVSEVMESSVIGVRRRSRVSELVHMLNTNRHHAFPVFLKVEGALDSMHDEEIEELDDSASISTGAGGTNDNVESSNDDLYNTQQRPLHPSSIITPTVIGMQATIFDDGRKRVMWLPSHSGQWVETHFSNDEAVDKGEAQKSGGSPKNAKGSQKSTTSERGRTTSSNSTRHNETLSSQAEISLDYQLVGVIDRSTLLMLLKHECDKREQAVAGLPVTEEISCEQLDAAWPNPLRMKGDEEHKLIERIKAVDVLEITIDFKDFIDPDPVLISERAHCMSAYRSFRKTGTRHILVTNMRSGRICGIMTRKDILVESLSEAVEKRNKNLSQVKVE